jgi:hypothetical protein
MTPQIFNRRQLVVTGALAVGAGFVARLSRAAAQTEPPRKSLASFIQDPASVQALKRAVGVMKARKPSDPTSWFYQAAIHGVPDDLIADAARRDPGVVRNVDRKFWNQCTHFSKSSSAEFVVWHRAYVYYFERILRAASGNPTLSLPYWNYADPAQRECPRIFADPDRDPKTRNPRNPLYERSRDTEFVRRGLSEATVSVSEALGRTSFFAGVATAGFAGSTNDQSQDTQGWIEMQPHDKIHETVGGLMGNPSTAAFDPLFWVHHCNIDRLWSLWDCSKNSSWGVRPRQAWLDARPWWFVDADGSTKNLPRSYYLNAGTLGVSYDSQTLDCTTPVSAIPINGAPPGPERVLLGAGDGSTVVGEQNGTSLSANSRTSTSIPVSPDVVSGNSSGRELLTARGPKTHVLLQVSGIKYDSLPSVGYGVFVNLPKGAEPVRSGKHYVGNLSLFRLNHGSQNHGKDARQLFDITEIARATDFDPNTVHVDIVPFDLLRSTGAQDAPARSGNTAIGKYQVIVIEVPDDQ